MTDSVALTELKVQAVLKLTDIICNYRDEQQTYRSGQSFRRYLRVLIIHETALTSDHHFCFFWHKYKKKYDHNPSLKIIHFNSRRYRSILHRCVNVMHYAVNEPRRENTGFLHMRKQRRRSASR